MESTWLRRLTATLAMMLCWTTSNAQSLTPPPAAQPDTSSPRVLPTWVEVRGGAWHVPPELVREIAQRLQEGAAHADLHQMATYQHPLIHLDDYTIQYRGELNQGASSVRILGDCHGHHQSDDMLSKKFSVIMDGGACIFDAMYSPKEHRFSAFAFHGAA